MIALVDCNSFFCSCEQIFRPDLANRPIVVLSNNDGCAVSINPLAKKFGIKVGEPYFEFKHLVEYHQIKIFSANFSLYHNISMRVRQVLSALVDDFEVYSIDEAFLDLNSLPKKQIVPFCEQLKDKIFRDIGISVSIGIAPTKVLAKMANYLCKKNPEMNGLMLIEATNDTLFSKIEAKDLWGIGPSSAKKLKMIGIQTALDLKNFSNKGLLRKVLSINAVKIQEELRGHQTIDFEEIQDAKSISCSRSFAQDLTELAQLHKAMAMYISMAGQKLRQQKQKCSQLSLGLRTKEGLYFQQTFFFHSPTHDEILLIQAGGQLLEDIFQKGHIYKKCGVGLSHLSSEALTQLSLFSPPQNEKSQLMEAIDHINHRFGQMSIFNGSCQKRRLDFYHQNHRSPNYTLGWNDLPKAL